jgi:hypothetical protein
MAPDDPDALGPILNAQHGDTIDLGVALCHDDTPGVSPGDQLRAVLDGLSRRGPGDVSIHVVSLDAVGGPGTDG